jgi:hypothetical protein
MNKLKRLSLLPEPEIADLYARPIFNHNEQLLYFELLIYYLKRTLLGVNLQDPY